MGEACARSPKQSPHTQNAPHKKNQQQINVHKRSSAGAAELTADLSAALDGLSLS